MFCLNQIDIGKKCRILSLGVEKNILRRFIDIGLIPGVEVEKVLISPFGGISAYAIMGSLIAIRDQDLEGVMVKYENL